MSETTKIPPPLPLPAIKTKPRGPLPGAANLKQRWTCSACQQTGVVAFESWEDSGSVYGRIKDQHKMKTPTCTQMARVCGGWRGPRVVSQQTELTEDPNDAR
jgi:hypothetical protein